MRKVNHRKSDIKHRELCENLKKKKPWREGEKFHYDNGDYNSVLCVLGFLGSIDNPSPH